MQVKNIISILAISLTMSVAGPAFAQTTINGMAISADDMPKVQARCDEINADGGANTISDELESDGADNAATAGGDATGTDETKDDSADTTASGEPADSASFDMSVLNAESCAQFTTK